MVRDEKISYYYEDGEYEPSRPSTDEYAEQWGFSYDDEELYPNEGD